MSTPAARNEIYSALSEKLRTLVLARYGFSVSIHEFDETLQRELPLLITFAQLETTEAQAAAIRDEGRGIAALKEVAQSTSEDTRRLLGVTKGLALLTAALLAVTIVTLVHVYF